MERDESPVVSEVFSMFKTYLESKLDEKTKQLESKSKLDKQVKRLKKRLKKTKEAASRKRRQPTQGRPGPDKKFKGSSTSTDQQLFRGELA